VTSDYRSRARWGNECKGSTDYRLNQGDHNLHKVLVPLDGSDRAAAVVPAAASFARALGSELLLLRVVAPEAPTGSRAANAQEREEAQAEAQAYLEQVAAEVRGPGLPVTVITAFGYPTTRIVETVRHDPFITRMAMATHGAGEAPGRVFGHTVEELVRAAGVPVLLVGSGQTLRPLTAGSTILVPFDNSTFAHHALNEAESIAATVGATLLIVSVLPPFEYLAQQGQTPAWFIEERQHEANRITRELEQLSRRIAANGLPVRVQLAEGQPAEEIAKLAAASGAALIVMAAYGESALHWGRVALAVLRLASVPILLPALSRAHGHEAEDVLRLTAPAFR
jgi:nucleotide-binding universal stress UspA family protein